MDQNVISIESAIKQITDLHAVQAENLNDSYMIGLYNGLELALSILERREPIYRQQGGKYRQERNLYDVQHSDDIAVVRFALKMREKLALARTRGRHGWEQADRDYLSELLYDHMVKGDPVDVANFCMMLSARNLRIAPLDDGK